MGEFFSWQDAPRGQFAVVGHPISHSKSPQMHQAIYRELGLEYTYVAIEILPAEFGEALEALTQRGFRGINVTVPNKSAAAKWAAKPDDSVLSLGVANTLSLTDGRATNTDAPGFQDTLQELRINPGRVLVLGAGGTTSALLPGLVAAGWEVTLWNRTASKAQELADQIDEKIYLTSDPNTAGFDLILNTTSASLGAEQLPVTWSLSTPGSVAYDLAYGEGPTPFLQTASEFGWRTCDGRGLLVAQGARSFEWWTGLQAPRAAMLEAIR